MLTEIIKFVMTKSIGTDLVRMAVKSGRNCEDVLREKLGVSSIDEFMRMNIRDRE